ncbi:TetR family transcriptional regulator [Gordonia sp. HNM0687]|uniref:TetR family transcriptional regulator n=1 Tax=Gordonia mangrovi TaxID=2665643 RepID=A0A6L7GP71_9ACTN|nr:TetR/AcrR family transcriptional regulator [Gordonia mangrovi]MXP21670.1 TetR family transcriptional regulator [Gordonia mangrovi]UVF80405.1 TetR family transcriptional regulator [Gordonia mangrovi]
MTGPVARVPREEVRRRLFDAAVSVFAERGYAGARMDEIARVAGFTKGAVYSNFSSKHALLAELIEDKARTQLVVGNVEVRAQNRPHAALEDIAEVWARGIVEQEAWTRLLTEIAQLAARDPEVRELYAPVRRGLRTELADTLRAAAEELGIEITVPVEQLALTLQALRLGLALEHGTDPDRVDRATLTAVFTATLRGVFRHTSSAADLRTESATPREESE